MKSMIRKSTLLAGCAMAAVTMPAFAQDAADADDSDIIIVTAQNRSQDVQDVPIAMNVIGAEELANAGFSNANDISRIAPSVQLNQDQGTVKITVRGVGTNSNDEAQDTSVVANVDGEYINRPNIMSVALFDMERVEVLRGPQGTLYGRNSTGGAINFITRKPGNEFGVNLSASYGNYDHIRIDGGVDAPLGDVAAVRVAGFYEDRKGYVKHPAGYGFGPFPAFAGGRSDDNESFGGRATFAIDDLGGLSVNLAAEYAEREFTPQTFAFADLNQPGNAPAGPGCNRQGFEQVAPAFAETLCVPSNTNFLSGLDRSEYASPGFGLGRVAQETWAIRGRISYEFSPAATLTYIGGYRDYSGGATDGSDFLTLPVAYRSFNFVDEAQTQSHEIRLNGEIGNGIVYQIGGFYFKEELDRENGFFLPIGANGTYLSYFGRAVESESKSIFGQVEFPLGETLTAIGGLRYTDNKRDALYLNGSPFGAGPPDCVLQGANASPSNCLFDNGPSRKDFASLPYLQTLPLGSAEDKITWLAGLNWQPNPDTLVYAKVSTGFKGGGFDAVGAYAPETNTAYEIGLKKGFGDFGQHTLNITGFYYDYKDLQVSVLLDTTVGGQTFNAGKATIWGIEAEAEIELDENDFFSASFNYLNAEYDELLAQYAVFCVGGCDITGIGDLDPTTPQVEQPNFAGNRPAFSPEFIITMGYRHVFELGGSGSVTAMANTTFKSSYFTDFFNYRDASQKAFTQSDLSLEYKPESGNWSILAFVRNLENTRPLTYGGLVAAGPDDIFNWQFGTPRTYGVKVGIDF